jgi:hypothetical protein
MRYRIRGAYSTYYTGKNKWKFRFNRGHYFQGRDDYGRKYDHKVSKFNLGSLSVPWVPQNRGIAGMDEAFAFRLFNSVDVPACNTNWFQFRIIDSSVESNPANQYEGDLWGLYLMIEQPDSRFLDSHGLPDGNLYNLQLTMPGYPKQANQGSTEVTDNSDVLNFVGGSGYNKTGPIQPLSWWETNVNLDAYYSYRTIVEAINHTDLRDQENSLYYHHPDTGQWWMLPWDLDAIYTQYDFWGPDGVNADVPFEQFRKVLEHEEANIAFKNRGREIQDLLLNSDQAWQLVDELARVIDNPQLPHNFAEVERAMWDQNPIFYGNGSYYLDPFVGPYSSRDLVSADFAGLVQYAKEFIVPGGFGGDQLSVLTVDADIPSTPLIVYTGPVNNPINALTFQTSAYSDPQGSGTFEAMKWRIAEVEPNSMYSTSVSSDLSLLDREQSDWKYFKGDSGEPSAPVEAWRQPGFNDAGWFDNKQTSIGYGDGDDNTELTDMLNNYTTIYLRNTFEVTDLSEIDSLTIETYVDDGCVIWLNGTEVFRSAILPAGFIPYDGTTYGNQWTEPSWQSTDLTNPSSYLQVGTNVIAIHAINSAITSSDLSIDISLTANLNGTGTTPGIYTTSRRKYEIDPKWESGEIAPFSDTITIPASVVKPGKTYRVRCRMKDDTGRWSHWSDPNQFVAGDPLSVGIIDDLCVTELMYNPAEPTAAEVAAGFNDNDDFEFIELKNTGGETLDLTYVSFIRHRSVFQDSWFLRCYRPEVLQFRRKR